MQVQQPNQFHCYNQTMDFVDRTDQNVAKYRIGILMKKWRWAPFAWMVDVVLQNVWVLYRINKDQYDESLPLLAFRRHVVNGIFLKFKGRRSSSSHVGIRNVPSDVHHDYTKHYQVPSEK